MSSLAAKRNAIGQKEEQDRLEVEKTAELNLTQFHTMARNFT
jgi:hypothetical protein